MGTAGNNRKGKTKRQRISGQARAPRRKAKGRGKVILLAGGLAFLLCALIVVYTLLHVKVMELRRVRARQTAEQVLQLTSLTAEDRQRYAQAIAIQSVSKGLNPAVVAAIIVVESSGNPLTVASSGDLGLMQVNVKIHARDFDFQNQNLLNPEENIDVGTSILETMLKRHGESKAIAAYNGLLAEKQGYAGKVHAAMDRAGIPQENQTVGRPAPPLDRLSDWFAAARQLFQSNRPS